MRKYAAITEYEAPDFGGVKGGAGGMWEDLGISSCATDIIEPVTRGSGEVEFVECAMKIVVRPLGLPPTFFAGDVDHIARKSSPPIKM